MEAPVIHPSEAQRLAVLHDCQVLDTSPEPEFDGLTQLARSVSTCASAMITFIDEHRQWFKSTANFSQTQSERRTSFCGHAIVSKVEPFIVTDARTDPTFADNPFVTGGPKVVFYAGFPLHVGIERLPVGTLCVFDSKARDLSPEQVDLLKSVARQAEVLLEARLRERELEATVRQLSDTEALSTAIVTTMHDGIVMQVQGGAITWSNPAAARILGLTRDQLEGRTSLDPRWGAIREDGSAMPGQDHPAMVALRTGQPVKDVLMGVGVAPVSSPAKDDYRWITISSVPLFRAGETSPWAAVTSFSDVTDLRTRQRELEVARDYAEAAGRAKSEFLATMSHELRTPMNGVIGLTELLLNDAEHPLDPHHLESLSAIRESGQALLSVINDVLDYSTIEAGGREFAQTVFHPEALVGDVVRLLTPEAGRRNLSLLQAPSAVGLALADVDAVRQVLFNLVGNALKFTAQGRVTVSLDQLEQTCRIEVRDTGIGIKPEHLPRLFQRFSQAEGSTRRRFGGTGLGLAICRRLVEGMGGAIGVESEPGQGTRFWFTLPSAPAGVRLLPAIEAKPAVTGPRPLRVLLVEDTAINQRVSLGMLRRFGHVAELAIDGFEAVSRSTHGHYDLILMDIQMPGMDGLEATRVIRAHETAHHRPRTPIIALTASAMPDEQAECLAAGMDDVLAKPLTLSALSTKLARFSEAPVENPPA